MTQNIRKYCYALLALALLALAIFNWLISARELSRFYTNMWIWDAWDYLSHFEGYKHFDLSVFWIQHNEHRQIGTEISYFLDIVLFHGRQILPEVIEIAAYLGVLVLFSLCVWRSAKSWPSLCAALLALAIAGYKLCVVSLASPFLTSWPQWEFFAVAALTSLALHRKRGGKLLLLAAMLFALAATYSMSNGMLVWPLLVASALLLRLSVRDVSAIAIAGAGSIALYFFHYKNLHTMSLGVAMHNPGYLLMFLGSFLGMPFSTAFHTASLAVLTSICGWIALLLAVIDLFFIVRRKLFRSTVVIVLGGFCILVLASALLTAAGRMNPADPGMVASRAGRYLTEPTLFWCALLMLTVWLLNDAWNGYAAFVFIAACAVLTFKILPLSSDFYNGWVNYFQRGQWASIGFANGIGDKSVEEAIFPSHEYMDQFKPVLIDNHLAIFAGPEPGWVGKQWSQVFSRGSDGFIHGEVTSVKTLGGDFEVQGWADGVTRVVFVDETGRIVGFGMRPRAGPVELYSHDVPAKLAFTGFIRGEFGAHEFSLWAVDRNGRQISRMGILTVIL